MKNKFISTTIFFIMFVFHSCFYERNDSHTNTLIIINDDFNRYDSLFIHEVDDLYRQIEKILPKDSIEKQMQLLAFEIRNHSNSLTESLDRVITEECNSISFRMPTFYNYSVLDWKKLNRDNFFVRNKCDVKSAFIIKKSLHSFLLHLIYANQNHIHSSQLESYLKKSINTYDYFIDETWEQTLIVDKSSLDLITTLNKIKFEIKMSEFATIRQLKINLDKE